MTGQTQGWSMNTDFLLTGDKEFGDFNVEYLLGGTIFYQEDKTIYGSTLLSGENSPKQLLLINNHLVTRLIKFFD